MNKKITLFIGLIILGLVVIFAVPSSKPVLAPTQPVATSTVSALPQPVRGPRQNAFSGLVASDIAKIPIATPKKSEQSQKANQVVTVPTKNIALIAGDVKYSLTVPEGATAYEAMQLLASTTSFKFTSKEFSGLGFMIESINGKQNSDGFYWTLYINGTYAQVGASTYIPKSADVIEWKYEKM